MCMTCYEQEYGAPRKVTQPVLDILDELTAAEARGALHAVIEDWNLEDDHIEYHLTLADTSEADRSIATRLLALDLDERATAMAVVDGYIAL